MLRKIRSQDMGRSDLGWLNSLFHFSFADYYNSGNMNFGVLRVINDDLIKPNTGFDTHPHRDMEIISYVVEGALTHGDSMGNQRTLTRGEVQYMSAGTGVYHSEHNRGDSVVRLLQIWILPDKKGYAPQYGDYQFPWDDRRDAWLPIASGNEGKAPIRINQDASLYVTEITNGKEMDFQVGEGRQAYMVLVEGQAVVNGLELDARDALEIIEESIHVKAAEESHILIIEMKKSQ